MDGQGRTWKDIKVLGRTGKYREGHEKDREGQQSTENDMKGQ
jgi:hypothetical protein